VGIDLDKHAPSLFHFVGELVKETTPRRIVNRSGEHTARESLDVQVFNGDEIVAIDQPSTEFVLEVRALITNMNVSLLKKPDGLPPICPTLFSPRDLTLTAPEPSHPRLEIARIGNQLAVGERYKGRQPHIDADTVDRRRYCRTIEGNRETRVPLIPISFEGECLNLPGDRSVHLDLDDADTLDFEPAHLRDVATIAPSRECVAVKTFPSLETGITRLFSSLDPTKEGSECPIDTPEYIMASREVSQFKIARITNLFQLVGLVIVIARYALHLPSISSFLKGGVVQSTSLIKLMLKRKHLLFCRIQAILKGLPQIKSVLHRLTLCHKGEPVADGLYLFYHNAKRETKGIEALCLAIEKIVDAKVVA